MKPLSLFASKYLKAADLGGVSHAVTIKKVVEGAVGDDAEIKPIVYFHQFEKGLCLNVGNTKRIIGLYGDDDAGWFGKWITIFPSECDLRGETVDCIRVKKDAPPVANAAPPEAAPATAPAMTPEMLAQFQAFMAMKSTPPTSNEPKH